jgi:hypothetical protein
MAELQSNDIQRVVVTMRPWGDYRVMYRSKM